MFNPIRPGRRLKALAAALAALAIPLAAAPLPGSGLPLFFAFH